MKKTLLIFLVLSGCRCSAAPSAGRFLTIYVKEQPFRVELATTAEQHARGLMFRRSLRGDCGMLFVFDDDQVRSFWMKNTLIPLDMIFLNAAGQVVGLHLAVPPCTADPCPNYESDLPARYVLELAAGTAERLKLAVGDKIFLPID